MTPSPLLLLLLLIMYLLLHSCDTLSFSSHIPGPSLKKKKNRERKKKKEQVKRKATQIPNMPVMPRFEKPHLSSITPHTAGQEWQNTEHLDASARGATHAQRFVYGTTGTIHNELSCLVGVKQHSPSRQKLENEEGFSSPLLAPSLIFHSN